MSFWVNLAQSRLFLYISDMHKLKELAMMYAGMAGYRVFWCWWPKPDRNGLTSTERFGLYFVLAGGVFGTILILFGVAP
jgi:hypothetical protein